MGGRGASSGRRPHYLTGIGLDSRITGEGESTGPNPMPQGYQQVTEAQAREAEEWAGKINDAKLAELRERDAAAERAAAVDAKAAAQQKWLDDFQRDLNRVRNASDRQVVSYAQPKLTQAQINAQDAARRQREIASDQRARARWAAERERRVASGAERAPSAADVPTARVVPASQPGFFSRLGSKLFGGKK